MPFMPPQHRLLIQLPLLLVLAGGTAHAQSDAPSPPVRGAGKPVVTIVEFSDFECPFCARAAPVIDSLLALHGDAVRLEYRHYPLPMHAHAEHAAQAAVEAQRQGAFWGYHDLLYRHQDRLADADLVGYADSLGLDAGAFAAALADGRHADRVDVDVTLGYSLAVTGTPTYFLNGYRISGVPPLWALDLALEAFRADRVDRRSLEPLHPPETDGPNGR